MLLNKLKILLVVAVASISIASAANPFSKSETRDIEPFSKIEVGGLVNVKINQGDVPSAYISAYGIDMSDIITRVEDDTLFITTKGNHRGESIHIDITYLQLSEIKTSGVATIKTDGALASEKLRINITGNGDAKLAIDTQDLVIHMQGNGNLQVSGTTNTQAITSHGGGGRLDNSNLDIRSI